MYQKFIITGEGVLRFGNVYQHRELLRWGEECPYGGGLWKVDEARRAILLYGRSFAFGPPSIEQVKRIEWSGIGGIHAPYSIFLDGRLKRLLCPCMCSSLSEEESEDVVEVGIDHQPEEDDHTDNLHTFHELVAGLAACNHLE